MSVVGISFGSATGGTGFDVSSTVTSILSNMRAPETTWATRTTALQAQDTALSSLGSDMSALSTALATLTSFDGSFAQKSGAMSNGGVAVLTNADNQAMAGTHTLNVSHLATSSTQHSDAVATGATLSGTFSFTVGTGSTQTIALDSSNNTVSALAGAINNLNAGVKATVISDSSGSHLSLISNTSGAAGEISTDTSGVTASDGSSLAMTETVSGRDAAYTLDGVPLTSSSNTVTGAIAGVTFQLVGASSSDVTMEIANDTSTVSSALSTFVTAYNTLTSALSAQEGKDASGNAQPLFGDRTLSLIQSQISSALAFVTGSTGSSSNLAELGITVGATGQLSLDTGTLSTALSQNFNGAVNFFQNAGDFGQNLTTVLSGLGNSGNGALALRSAENTTEETNLASNKTNLETRIAAYSTQLTSELNTANEILQGIPQQLNEIKQIYAAITGYGNSA